MNDDNDIEIKIKSFRAPVLIHGDWEKHFKHITLF